MKQIIEDYVSFEIAQLLKEKEFDIKCNTYFISDNEIAAIPISRDFNNNGIYLSAPSQSLALKWLREVHNIHISINVGCDVDNKNYVFYTPTIVKLSNKNVEYIDPFCEDEFNSNEQAVEAALKYTLENLI